MTHIDEISIFRVHSTLGAWRATCHLPKVYAAEGVRGVKGQLTSKGAWVEGHGDTPGAALQSLQRALGHATMYIKFDE